MKRATTILAAIACAALVASILFLSRAGIAALLRRRLETSLSARFQSRVEISGFYFALSPSPTLIVRGLTLYHHNRTDVPPLLRIASLSMSPYFSSLFAPALRFSRIQVNGLDLTFPPRDHQGPSREPTWPDPSKFRVFIDELDANDATITLLRAERDKDPLVYPVHRLTFRHLKFDASSEFEAMLTNAVPRGEIHVRGTFGPWNSEDPRTTPLQAGYEFLNADLGTIKGLRGKLSSTGTFGGPLDYLDVKGTTITPDFTLRRVDNPLELRTTFSATVDGTNGNTYLHSVEAHFLSTTLYTSGEVVDLVSGVKSRTIILEAQADSARAEDLIRLAVKTDTPVLKGPVRLRALIHIPEKDEDLSDRLDVRSTFVLTAGVFGNPQLQAKVDGLSRKGQGQPTNGNIADVPSRLQTSMRARGGIVGFRRIDYSVPGAELTLHGTYTLGSGNLDFHGVLLLDAKLSQTTTGIKSLVLKPIDPFFRSKDGGTRLPVKISGTKDHPSFGWDRGNDEDQAFQIKSRKSEVN